MSLDIPDRSYPAIGQWLRESLDGSDATQAKGGRGTPWVG